jgi:hypothetical protein
MSTLPRRLTGDAVPRPWECFQPFGFNVAAAFGTLTVASMLDPLQRPVQILDLLLGGSSFVGEGLSLELNRRLISGVCVPRGVCAGLFGCAGEETLGFRQAISNVCLSCSAWGWHSESLASSI